MVWKLDDYKVTKAAVLIAIGLFLIALASTVGAYTINGTCVYQETAHYKIEQCPAILTDLTNYVNLSVTNKDSSPHNIMLAYGFDTNEAKPRQAWRWGNAPHQVPTYGWVSHSYTCDGNFNYTLNPKYFWCFDYNETLKFEHSFVNGYPANKTAEWFEWEQNGWQTQWWNDWIDVSSVFTTREFQGKTWYYAPQNISFAAHETKVLRALVQVKPYSQGKYDLFAWRGEYSPQEAWGDSSKSLLLDPWWDVSWASRKPITANDGYGVEYYQEPMSVNVTGLTLSTNNCSIELRVTANYTTETALELTILDNSGQSYAAGSQYCVIQYPINVSTSQNATYAQKNNTVAWVYYKNAAATDPAWSPLPIWDIQYQGNATPNSTGYGFSAAATPSYNHAWNLTGTNNGIWSGNDTGGNPDATWFRNSSNFAQITARATFESRMKVTSSGGSGAQIWGSRLQGNQSCFILVDQNGAGVGQGAQTVGSWYDHNNTIDTSKWHVYRAVCDGYNTAYELWVDGQLVMSGTNSSVHGAAGATDYQLGEVYWAWADTLQSDIDYAYAARTVLRRPLNAVLGAEELNMNTNITISSPSNASYSRVNYIDFNFTVVGSDATYNCSYWLDGARTDLGLVANNTLNWSNVSVGLGSHNITVNCSNTSSAVESVFFSVLVASANDTFNTYPNELNSTTLNLSVTVATAFSDAEALLEWNGTNYSTTSGGFVNATGSEYFYKTVTIPLILSNETEVNFTWWINATYPNGTRYSFNETGQQYVVYSYYPSNVTVTPSSTIAGATFYAYPYLHTDFITATLSTLVEFEGTNYSATNISYGYYSKALTAPTPSGLNESFNITAWFFISDNGTTRVMNYTGVLFVSEILLSNCVSSNATIIVFNFTFSDEADPYTLINGSMNSTFWVWTDDMDANNSFSFNFTNVQNATICLYPANTTVQVASFQEYIGADDTYMARHYFLDNASVSTADGQHNITLYSVNTSIGKYTRLVLQDNDGTKITGAYVTAQRYYPATNDYFAVAMFKTDDNGEGVTPLVPNTAYYRFVVTQDGEVIGAFSSRQVICSLSIYECDLSLRLSGGISGEFFSYWGNVAYACSFNNATNWTTCTFQDTTGTFHKFTLTVTKVGYLSSETICTDTATASSGTLVCSVNESGYYVYTLYAGGSPDALLVTGEILKDISDALFGNRQVLFLGLLILSSVGLAAFLTPATGVMFFTIGLIGAFFFGLINVNPAMLVGIIVLGVIVAWKLKL